MRYQINKVTYQEMYEKFAPILKDFKEKGGFYVEEPAHLAIAKVGFCSCCHNEVYGLWYCFRGGQHKRNLHYRTMDEMPKWIVYKSSEIYDMEQKYRLHEEPASFVEPSEGAGVKCPICKEGYISYISRHPNYHVTVPDGILTDEFLDQLLTPLFESSYDLRNKELYALSEKQAEEKLQFIENSCSLQFYNGAEIKIETTEKLKEYIYRLVQLEGNIASLQKRLIALYYEFNKNKCDVARIDWEPSIKLQNKIEEDKRKFDNACKKYNNLVRQLKKLQNKEPKKVVLQEPSKPLMPQYQKPGLFNKKRILLENKWQEERYQREMQEYSEKYKIWQEEVERQNQIIQEKHLAELRSVEKGVRTTQAKMESLRINPEKYILDAPVEVCPEKAKHHLLIDEIEKAENLLMNTVKARNELYSINLIFGKYRDIVALSTFYEYLMSGRCTTLEGANGAYNLYEAEIRANMIISKLSDIEKSLKDIERSQYMIYSQLVEMNRTLTHVASTMESAYSSIVNIEANTSNMTEYMAHISQNSDVIAHNTAVTAYYSKINAELTDALGFMVALK